MRKDGIDASLGLAFSLELFKRYRKSGLLQAEISRMAGIRGRCNAFLHLVNGEIISVYLEDKQRQRYSSDKETLCRLDNEKGPFEWTLVPHPAAPDKPQPVGQFQPSFPDPLPYAAQRSPVPKIISTFSPDWLSDWNPQQKAALYVVLNMINGERTIEGIKGAVSLHPQVVDELLHILQQANVIALSNE